MTGIVADLRKLQARLSDAFAIRDIDVPANQAILRDLAALAGQIEAVFEDAPIVNVWETDSCSPPGETLKEIMEEKESVRAWAIHKFGALGITLLIKGLVPITPTVADALKEITGVPVAFWLMREANYRVSLERDVET